MQEEFDPLQISITSPSSPMMECFRLGTAYSPSGDKITADSRSLRRNGTAWLPVMGEFHYARYPASEWPRELLKIKAGGIDILATYVFWIHHEERQGVWEWTERRNLREFIALCGEVGLLVIVRLGPWCHGEVRNGGFPDWLVQEVANPRTDDDAYLAHTRRFYHQIGAQVSGLLWKDGGPIIGIQCENEYGGPAEHLLTLKALAIDAGFDVPLYTRTGWPDLSTPMPPGEFLPLFGGYPDGFWDRSTTEMPRGYRGAYLFTKTRADGAIATDLLGEREVGESDEDLLYPYFACEIGGGMERSYHRRIQIAPHDIEALGLVKLGSGNNLQGYYMYHGGTNPDGLLSTLQESQATGYWNDVQVKSYDFQAPLGEFGQVRPHYHALRRMHLFLSDFGPALAEMPTLLPAHRPADADDCRTLRWSVRTDGRSGFIFINNYQRLQEMPPKEQTRFHLCLPDACLHVPAEPVTFPADTAAFWPVHFDLGGIDLVYATAQPICRLDIDGMPTFVFAETPGLTAEFVFDAPGWTIDETTGSVHSSGNRLSVTGVKAGLGTAIRLRHPDGSVRGIILLDRESSLACWKEKFLGQDRLFLTRAALVVENEQTLRLNSDDPSALCVAILPCPSEATVNGGTANGIPAGLFGRFDAPLVRPAPIDLHWEQIRCAGPARVIPTGSQGVAEAPEDEAFDHAAVWRIHLPQASLGRLPFRLRVRYIGDVARLYCEGRLLTDNFYNGDAFEIGLARYARIISRGEFVLKILPLRKDAPIYLPGAAWPDFKDADAMADLQCVEAIHEHEVVFEFAP